MKRVIVDHYGGPEVLKVVEDEDPRPGPGEVRVRVLAAGVSFTDAQMRAGTYIAGARSHRSRPATNSSASSKNSTGLHEAARGRSHRRVDGWAPTPRPSVCRRKERSTSPTTSIPARS